MRALEAEVVDATWAAIEPLLAPPPPHPLGCHRPRVPDRVCFWGLLIRLTTGSSWVDIEAILDHRVSDTTLRARRDEWIAAGVESSGQPAVVTPWSQQSHNMAGLANVRAPWDRP